MDSSARERIKSYVLARQQNPAWQLLASRRAPLVLACLQQLIETSHDGVDYDDAQQALANLLAEHASLDDFEIAGDVAALARKDHRCRLLHQSHDEQAQFSLLLYGQRIAGGWMAQDQSQLPLHRFQFDLVAQLLVEAVEHPPFNGLQQVVVAIQQTVDDGATMVAFVDHGMTQVQVCLAPRILDAAEVGTQARREREQLADAFAGFAGVGNLDATGLGFFQLVLQSIDLSTQMAGSTLRIGIQARFQSLDLALHRCQSRCRGGHDSSAQPVDESERCLQRIGGI